jgi:putative OPT family oligopeptide transporter
MTSPENNAPESAPAEVNDGQLYVPAPGERQLSFRAVAAGCFLGWIVVAGNLYLGLSIGWSVGGSLMAAILGFAFFQAISPRNKYTVLECNITQTAGSGAGTMASAAGLLAPIPALKITGHGLPDFWELSLWSLSIAYLGVMFAVPLRRQYVVTEQLKFPTGTAVANTIVAMFSTAGEAVAKARVLLWFGIGAFVFTVGTHFIPQIGAPPLHEWLGIGVLATAAAWTFSLYLGPMLFGAGFLIGPRVTGSMLAGAIVGWGILGYIAQHKGWAPASPTTIHDTATDTWGPRGWILWPGVAIMVGDALMSLGLSWKTFVRAFKRPTKVPAEGFQAQTDPEAIPNSWWVIGLGIASAGTILVAHFVFDIPLYLSVLAIALSAVLANVAVRSTGETDINPIGGVGKVTQMAFGAINSSIPTNLMTAGIAGAGASQAGDMMQDLKTGYLLGASPRKQFRAQLFGVAAGSVVAVATFYLFDKAYDVGADNSKLLAPAAHAWAAVAQVMTRGTSALPQYAVHAMICGLAFGALIPVLRKSFPKAAPYLPSGLAFGIAFIVHAFFSICMFLGAMVSLVWSKSNPKQHERFVFAVACGLIAGEGLGGVLNAGLMILGVEPLF